MEPDSPRTEQLEEEASRAAEEHGSVAPRASDASSLVFWFLLLLALAAFTPCVVLPEWRDYQAARVAEEVASRENVQLRTDLDAQQRALDGVRNDPVVIERMARRELAYQRTGEVVVPAAVVSAVDEAAPPAERIEAPAPPALIERLLTWLPFAADDNIFCDPSTRKLIMGLSGSLLLAAFLLFPPRRAARRA